MTNLYNYEIKDHKGKIITFEGQKNSHTKEQNKQAFINLFESAEMSGKIYAQDDKNEYYIFIEGNLIESQEPRDYGYIKKYTDDLDGYHEIRKHKEPLSLVRNGKTILFDTEEIEQFKGAIGGDLETYIFYYYKGEIVYTN